MSEPEIYIYISLFMYLPDGEAAPLQKPCIMLFASPRSAFKQ